MPDPSKEVWYCFKVYKCVEGYEEDGPRLLTPWADPDEYEYPFNFLWHDPSQAREGLVAEADLPDDDDAIEEFLHKEGWVLCRMTLEPIGFHTTTAVVTDDTDDD